MNKTLIIVRHAHRETEQGRERDNGLSKKGKKQTDRIVKFYEDRYETKPAELLSSAKKRCLETLEPLAKLIGGEVKTVDELMEFESGADFNAQVDRFHERWLKSKHDITVACSHGDWIPVYLDRIVHHAVALKKGGWVQIEIEDKVPRLKWVLQELP